MLQRAEALGGFCGKGGRCRSGTLGELARCSSVPPCYGQQFLLLAVALLASSFVARSFVALSAVLTLFERSALLSLSPLSLASPMSRGAPAGRSWVTCAKRHIRLRGKVTTFSPVLQAILQLLKLLPRKPAVAAAQPRYSKSSSNAANFILKVATSTYLI